MTSARDGFPKTGFGTRHTHPWGRIDLRQVYPQPYKVDLARVATELGVPVYFAKGAQAGNWPVTDTAQSEGFRPFYDVNAAVGLGLLFLVAPSSQPVSPCTVWGWSCPQGLKFAMMTVLGVLVIFGVAHLSRRVPGLRFSSACSASQQEHLVDEVGGCSPWPALMPFHDSGAGLLTLVLPVRSRMALTMPFAFRDS